MGVHEAMTRAATVPITRRGLHTPARQGRRGGNDGIACAGVLRWMLPGSWATPGFLGRRKVARPGYVTLLLVSTLRLSRFGRTRRTVWPGDGSGAVSEAPALDLDDVDDDAATFRARPAGKSGASRHQPGLADHQHRPQRVPPQLAAPYVIPHHMLTVTRPCLVGTGQKVPPRAAERPRGSDCPGDEPVVEPFASVARAGTGAGSPARGRVDRPASSGEAGRGCPQRRRR